MRSANGFFTCGILVLVQHGHRRCIMTGVWDGILIDDPLIIY